MASKRMTANPIKPARYRPGKPVVDEPSSEEDESGEDEDQQQQQEQQTRTAPPPKASSFPSEATRIAGNLKKVDLNERRKQAAAEEAERVEAERLARAAVEEGFETEESEEEDSGGESGSGSGSGSGTEESSSEDEAPKKLLRPTFIKKDKRKDNVVIEENKADDNLQWAEEEARRNEKADAMIQEQLEKTALAQAAGKKDWDDDEIVEVEIVDDTDDLDPEAERAAWKLRELKRVKRERETIEQAEKEREEVERRRNLSKEEREAEDKEFLDAQKEDREVKGKMGYMQKYFHKGAFFQDDAKAEGLDQRDIMGSRYTDDVANRELLPQYMQIRDMTKLGRKGRTKYKDLKSEDTGKWGTFEGKGPRKADGTLDERFMPDRDVRGKGASGANTTQVGERRKPPEAAPTGPRREGGDLRKEDEERRRSPRRRSYSRSGSPPPRRREPSYSTSPPKRQRERSRSRSPPPRRRQRSYSRSPPRRRKRSYTYSRSPSPRRDRYRNGSRRRKRSPSPYHDFYDSDKRRRVGVS